MASIHHTSKDEKKSTTNKHNVDKVDESFSKIASAISFDSAMTHSSCCNYVGLTASALCQQVLQSTKQNAQMVFDNLERRDWLAPFDLDEIILSKHIRGHGEFCNVYEVIAFKPKQSDKTSNLSPNENKARNVLVHSKHESNSEKRHTFKHLRHIKEYAESSMGFLNIHSKNEKFNKKGFVIKHLRPQLMGNKEKFILAAQHLASEAQLLACIDHPNIIKIRGCAIDGPDGYSSASNLNTGYFLILDLLECTLHDRILLWRKRGREKSTCRLDKLLNRKGLEQEKFWMERLKACVGIASALFYLHEHDIIFRDLKPQNIGFDIRGDVKLFDFGLAKFLPPGAHSTGDNHQLSGAGSLRYMAPEVVKKEKYNLKADVYGFALICWAALKMDIPFRGYNDIMLFDGVIHEGANGDRPRLENEWPDELQRMIESGWSYNSGARPEMKSCYKVLQSQLSNDGVDKDKPNLDEMPPNHIM